MKNMINAVKRQAGMFGAAVVGVLISGTASAALPAAATTALTDLATDVTSILDAIWPIVVLVTIGFVLMGLFKRGAAKV